MRLMIVDDHPGVRHMIRQLMAAQCKDVREYGSGDEAVAGALEFKPDCVTMDLHMPGIPAFQAVQSILKQLPSARIVMVSSYDQPELRRAAFEAGAAGYVAKNNLPELRRILNCPISPRPEERPSPITAAIRSSSKSGSNPTAELAARVEELEAFPGFIANALMGPVQTIRNFAGLLGQTPNSPANAETQLCAVRITDACCQIHQRLDALVEFSQYSYRVLRTERVRLDALVRECWNQVCLARNTQPDLRAQTLPEIQGDAALLRVLFTNLLDNAVKFSVSRPEPIVSVEARQDQGEWTFVIRDNGIGFDPGRSGRLFVPLGRLHTSVEYGGIGLGLALSRRIVQHHGGRIWAESAVDAGAAFHFTLGTHALASI